jgi:hypothetical protein
MTFGVPNGPRTLKADLVLVAPNNGRLFRIISLQYNPDTITRSYQVQGAGGDGGAERA